MRHLITWADYSVEEIRRIMEIATDLKQLCKTGNRPAVLERQVIGLLFEKPSLRTRVSFECLAHQTGGASLFLGDDVGWGKREPIQDFVPILTSYIDCLVVRSRSHDDIVEICKYSRCPVINGLTDVAHPCQALSDLMTIQELFGDIDDIKIAYVGDANNVAFSLAFLACKLGLQFSIAAPSGYQFSDIAQQAIRSQALGCQPGRVELFEQTDDPKNAAAGAHVIYTDVWTSMGQEAESDQRRKDFSDFQVNSQLFAHAAENAKFFHCLPARRGEEVTSSIIDGDHSATVLQAENRLHAQKGLVVWLLTEADRKKS